MAAAEPEPDQTPARAKSSKTAKGDTASGGGKTKAKTMDKAKDKATFDHVAEPPQNWPKNFMTQIEDTKKHAKGKRKDNASGGFYCYWKGREHGNAPKGRKVGALEGRDFAIKGETLKENTTELKQRLEDSKHVVQLELDDMKQLVEGKDKKIAELQEQLANAQSLTALHVQHGKEYGQTAQSKFSEVKGKISGLMVGLQMSPGKLELGDGPVAYEESFQSFLQRSQASSTGGRMLDMGSPNQA